MLTVLVVVILLLLMSGGFYGYRSGAYGGGPFGGIVGILFILLIVYLLFGSGAHY